MAVRAARVPWEPLRTAHFGPHAPVPSDSPNRIRVGQAPFRAGRRNPAMRQSRFHPTLAVLAMLTVFYFVACRLGLMLASVNRSATPVWPGTGIAFAAFLLLGSRAWPAGLLGAFLVNMTTA